MKQSMWYKDAIIYQIYPMSFQDSNDDGMGDLNGITSRLDYLKDLGINCVWLSPIYKSPMADNGYDISDYKDINPLFGTLDDFKVMISEMHKRGIKLVMDMVMNHTSDEHKWFIDAKTNINSPYRDYYFFRKANGKKLPNNWTGFFGDKAWSYVKETDSYYLHLFNKKQPDVNWDNPKVREEFKSILKFWCDLGVDGFRFDVINLISKKQDLKNGHGLFLKGADSFINGPHLHEYIREIYDDVLSKYDLLTVGETVFTDLKSMKELTGKDRHELTMVFNFDHTSADCFFGVKYLMRKFSLVRFKKALGKYQIGMQNVGWNTLFFENHDQRRSTGRFNTDINKYRIESPKALATAIYMLQGTPFIYEGQEIGMQNTDVKNIDDLQDVECKTIRPILNRLPISKKFIYKTIMNGTRDNARTPMQWDDSEFAGFSNHKPWIKVNDNKSFINVKQSINDTNSIYNYYQKLIELRKSLPVIKEGTYLDLQPNDKNIYCYIRESKSDKIMVIVNFSNKEQKIKNHIDDYKILINNYTDFKKTKLLPYQAVVIRIK